MTLRDEFKQQAAAKDENERYFQKGVIGLKVIASAIIGAYAFIAGVVWWAATIQGQVTRNVIDIHEIRGTANSAADALKIQDSSNKLALQALNSGMESVRSRVNEFDKLRPRIEKLWYENPKHTDGPND